MTFVISWPQIIFLGWFVIAKLLFVAVLHGQKVQVNIVDTLISKAILLALLYWGGFFG